MRYFDEVRQVRSLFVGTPKHRSEAKWLAARFLFRPISFVVTPVLMNFKMTANQLTLISFFLILGSLGLFVSGTNTNIVIGGIILFLVAILDYCDGNIARVQTSASLYGKLIDGLVDTFSTLHFAALGLGVLLAGENWSGQNVETILGVMTTLLILYFDSFNMRLMALSLENANIQGNMRSQNREKISWIRATVKTIYMNTVIANPAVLLILVIFKAAPIYIYLYFSMNVIFLPVNMSYSLYRARESLSAADPRSTRGEAGSGEE